MSNSETKARFHKAPWVWRQPTHGATSPGHYPPGPNPGPNAQHPHFYELVSKSTTTSTPGQGCLAPNHAEAQEQAALPAQTRRLAPQDASAAAAGSAVSCRVAGGRFPTLRNQHGSHQATANHGAEPLQEQHSRLPRKEITVDTERGTSHTPQNEGAGKAEEGKVGAGCSAGMPAGAPPCWDGRGDREVTF